MIAMPEPDRAVLGRRAEIVQALRRLVPGEGVIDHEKELRAFESDGLTAYRQPPDGRRASGDDGAGCRCPALLRREQGQGRPARRRNVAFGRRFAARRRRSSRHGQVQQDPRDRCGQPLRRRSAGRDQSRHHPRGAGSGALLCARPVEPDRLHDRRERRREFRRRALASNMGSRPTMSSASKW